MLVILGGGEGHDGISGGAGDVLFLDLGTDDTGLLSL